jgi:TRAP transporter 4TM/12TM fusion protein
MKLDWSHAGIFRLVVIVVSVAMAGYHMWAIAFGSPEAIPYRGTHLMFALVLVFLLYRFRSKTEDAAMIAAADGGPIKPQSVTPSIVDYALLIVGIIPILYLFMYYDYITNRIFYVDDLFPADIVWGTVMTLIVLEATRRVIGWALPVTALVFLFYAFAIARLDPMQLLDQLYMTTEGIFGIPLSVSASYVLIFVLFGSFMERTGTGQLFMDFALAITGHTAGGPGKVSVVSSSLFGTISGSAVANVMVDGPISIPLMKRTGFPPHFAAGVEATASTGGQIMPPIMGAAAFVMAEFLAVPYAQIVIWAIIPAVLYYVACFAAVHFEAKRRGLVGLPRSELPRMRSVFVERGHLFIPILTILVVMYSGYSAPMAALWGTLACFPVAALRASTRGYVNFNNVIDGIVIAVVTLSGLGIVFTQYVVGLAKDTLLLALVVTMCAGIVLGMGMPTTPAYIIMTALLVPAIIKLGVIAPAAHMFAFYFAVLSAITPPVALAVFAAAGLAKADLWASGWAAVKIGAAGFIVPFMLVYEPALMMIGTWPHIIGAFCTASVGILLFAAGLHGYFLTAANGWQRMLLIAGGLLLIDPGLVTDIIGAVVAAVVIAVQWPEYRRAKAAREQARAEAQALKQAT